jgi:predicted membrane GTPase involved in stress response
MAKVDKVQLFDNLGRSDSDEAQAGDIVAVTGLPDPEIGDTIADPLRTRSHLNALPSTSLLCR